MFSFIRNPDYALLIRFRFWKTTFQFQLLEIFYLMTLKYESDKKVEMHSFLLNFSNQTRG